MRRPASASEFGQCPEKFTSRALGEQAILPPYFSSCEFRVREVLRRRFPGLLPKDLLYGQVVILIRDATGQSPFRHAQNLVSELNEINDYAGQFHHDTNPDADSTVVTPSELKTYVERALDVVYKGTA